MRKYIHLNIIYIGLCLLFLGALGIVLLVCPKAELHLWLNQYHTPFLDVFFRGYTAVAEWVPYVIVVALLFYRFGWSAFLLANIALSALFGQIIKYIVNAPRPVTWFAENYPDIELQLVEGVHMNRFCSFPSGHTITFFVLFFTLSLIATDYWQTQSVQQQSGKMAKQVTVQIICFLLALIGAYSRIYLSQHFAFDIFGGTALALTVSVALCAVLPYISTQKWYKMHFFEKKVQKNLVD